MSRKLLVLGLVVLVAFLALAWNQHWMGYTKLSGEEIDDTLSGRSISNMGIPNSGHNGMLEKFEENGEWTGYYREFVLRNFEGTWSVANDELCVQMEDEPIECRPVWLRGLSETIQIADLRNPDPDTQNRLVTVRIGDATIPSRDE